MKIETVSKIALGLFFGFMLGFLSGEKNGRQWQSEVDQIDYSLNDVTDRLKYNTEKTLRNKVQEGSRGAFLLSDLDCRPYEWMLDFDSIVPPHISNMYARSRKVPPECEINWRLNG